MCVQDVFYWIRSSSIYFYERIIVDWGTQHTVKQKKQYIPRLPYFPICYLFLLLMVIAFSNGEALDRAPTRSLLGMWGFGFQETTWACPAYRDLNEAPPATSLSYPEGEYSCINILLDDSHFVPSLSGVYVLCYICSSVVTRPIQWPLNRAFHFHRLLTSLKCHCSLVQKIQSASSGAWKASSH